MPDPFDAHHAALFAGPLCQDATLRGAPVRVFVQHGVEMIGDYGQVVGHRTIVEFPSYVAPEHGDPVVISGVTYLLDTLSTDDGQIARWIVRREP